MSERDPIPNVPAEVGHDRSVNGRGDVEQTDGRTNPNYRMIYYDTYDP